MVTKVTVKTTISRDGKVVTAAIQGVQGDGTKDIKEALAQANTITNEEASSESPHEHDVEIVEQSFTR